MVYRRRDEAAPVARRRAASPRRAALLAWVWAGLPARSEVRALDARNPGKTRLMLQREEEARAREAPRGRGRQSVGAAFAASRGT
jgi:hypothetical protein